MELMTNDLAIKKPVKYEPDSRGEGSGQVGYHTIDSNHSTN